MSCRTDPIFFASEIGFGASILCFETGGRDVQSSRESRKRFRSRAGSRCKHQRRRQMLSHWASVGYASRPRRSPTLLVVLFFLSILSGCASWDHSPADQSISLPRAQLTPDAVVLEILTLKAPRPESDDAGELDAWRNVDEQALPAETRSNLAQNGLRGGLVRGQLPTELQRLLDSQRIESSPQKDLGNDKQPAGSEQRLQTRAGTRGKIVTTDIRDNMVVLTPGRGGLTGRSLQKAQGLLSARSFPRGDGSIDLELIPEVEYGEARQKWIGQGHEGSFRLDMNRECLSLENLRIRTRLQPGQTLVLGPTHDVKGIGQQFFTDGKSSASEQRLILIRLAQTQIDDLFAPEPAREPLATPVD